MKAAELHIKHLRKQIPKQLACNYNIHNRNVILRSDSKGRCLLPYFTNTRKSSLIHRSGAKLNDTFMQDYTVNKIKRTSKPLVILFFGTCEITNKQGKCIYLPQDLESRVDQVINRYIAYKQRILAHPGIFDQEQKRLEEAILRFNLKIKEINGDRVVPRLAVDFIYSVKKKKQQIRKFRNYSLLVDGVHANKFLAKLWSLRISRLISYN